MFVQSPRAAIVDKEARRVAHGSVNVDGGSETRLGANGKRRGVFFLPFASGDFLLDFCYRAQRFLGGCFWL